LIQTPTGERKIEDLEKDDLVLTPSGAYPIRWIGRRRLDPRRHSHPDLAQPVRIATGAFGVGLPIRDLYLSPRHCIAWSGVLIPIEVLVNGTSIQRMVWSSVEYFRLELEEHNLVWAEGMLAESYMYGGVRSDFENQDGPLALHPIFAYAPEEDTCLPLVIAGPAVDAVKARLVQSERAHTGTLARIGARLGRTALRLSGRA
jgi:hypothetical protein